MFPSEREKNIQIRSCIRMLFLQDFSPKQILIELRKIYGRDTVKKTTVYEWTAKFRAGEISVENKKGAGRKRKIDGVIDEDIEAILKENRKLTTRQIAKQIGISKTMVAKKLKELGFFHFQFHLFFSGYSKVCARWIPRCLTEKQKEKRLKLSSDLLGLLKKNKNFIDRIVTGDETWLPYFLEETKENSKEWRKKGEIPPTKPRPNKFRKKIMATIFWDSKGVLLVEFKSSKEKIDAASYQNTLKKLHHEVCHLRRRKKIFLLHDNATPHKAKKTKKLIDTMGWTVLNHPPYSPDLAPSDYFLFSQLKNYLRGINYPNNEELEFAVVDWLKKQNSNFYKEGMEKLEEKWSRCVEKKGDYFEIKKK